MTIFDLAPLSTWRQLRRMAQLSIHDGLAPSHLRTILKCDLLTLLLQNQQIAYTHRNGDTEAPTVPGLYWFRGTCDLWTGTINLQMALHTIERDGRLLVWEERSQEHLRVQCFAGQWWGPIAAPWESENVNQ